MKKIITLSIFALFVVVSISSQAQTARFIKTYGGNKVDSGRDLVICPDSGYMMVGNTSSFGAGDSDVYVIKVNKMGDTLWTRTYGGVGEELAHSIIPTADGNYAIAGSTTSYGMGYQDFWLLKINPNGNELWRKTYGYYGSDYAREVVQTSDGGYALVGSSNAQSTSFDMMVVKTDAAGTEQWKYYFGGSQFESGYSIKQTSDGGFIALGQTFSMGISGDVYMVKISSTGSKDWDKNFGGSYEEEGQFIQVTTDGGYVFTADAESGNAAGDFDVMITKTDAAGIVVWQKLYGGAQKDVVKSIYATSDGGYIVGAITRSFGLVNPDFWIMKLTSAGDTSWTRRFGGNNHEHCYAVKQSLDGGYAAVGHTVNGSNLEDFYFVKMDSNGSAVGVSEAHANIRVVDVYPNPTSNLFKLSHPGFKKDSQIRIFDVSGREMLNSQFNGDFETNTQAWAPGLYLITVQSGNEVYQGKVTVK